jgi:hypothetical protein
MPQEKEKCTRCDSTEDVVDGLCSECREDDDDDERRRNATNTAILAATIAACM